MLSSQMSLYLLFLINKRIKSINNNTNQSSFLTLEYTQVHGVFSEPKVVLTTDSSRPIDYSVSDSGVEFTPSPLGVCIQPEKGLRGNDTECLRGFD